MENKIHFATKALIIKDGLLLVIKKSSTEDVNPNTYDVPGGRLEFGEMPDESLKREVREEVGLEINIVKPIRVWSFIKDDNFQLVGVTFLCDYQSGVVKLSDEHERADWIPLKDISKHDLPSWLLKEIKAIG